MKTLLIIMLGVLSFGFLILIHEWGHFTMARKNHVKVSDFSIGFGPTLFKKNYKGVNYRLCLLPLGGYVKMPESPLSNGSSGIVFNSASTLSKVLVLQSGSLFNIFAGYFLLMIFMGIGAFSGEFYFESLYDFFRIHFLTFLTMIKLILEVLKDLFVGVYGISDLSGPVGITQVLGESIATSFDSYLFVMSFISINIGLFNLLPLPALDGMRTLFVIIEGIRKKPLSVKMQEGIHMVGLCGLLTLIILVTIKDIASLF